MLAAIRRLRAKYKELRTQSDDLKELLARAPASILSHRVVIGIGLSRTGTLSLASACRSLGLRTAHWRTLSGIAVEPELFYTHDAVFDSNAAFQFEPWYYTVKNSKFIYSRRDINKWCNSVARHFNADAPSFFRSSAYAATLEELSNQRETLKHWMIHENLYGGFDTWEQAYRAHEERVQKFFESRDPERYLEIDITSGDGWPELCEFLNLPIPDGPFPHTHNTATAPQT